MQYRISTTTRGWWRGTVVERRSLAGELSLSCARPAAFQFAIRIDSIRFVMRIDSNRFVL